MNREEADKNRQFLIENLTQELIARLIEEYGYDIPRAIDVLYSSKTYQNIEKESTGLYYQSAVYVYELLEKELKNQMPM